MACPRGRATGPTGKSISTSISMAPWGSPRFMRLSSIVIPGWLFCSIPTRRLPICWSRPMSLGMSISSKTTCALRIPIAAWSMMPWRTRYVLTRTSSATASRPWNTAWTLALRSTAIWIRTKACCASPTYAVEGERLPPHPEHDLLWFLTTYAPLEAWQRDVLQIMREESHYFYPQFNTKIMNEGWASYWHAELFHLYNGVSPEEMIEFARLHAGVVNPGGRYSINPYYLGYSMLVDIEKRWNQMHAAGETPLTGREKMFEVRRTEDDLSFLRNYLTPELVQRLNLFAYGSNCTHPPGKQCPQCHTVVITARERDAVVEALLAPRYNYGVPRIVIQEVVNNTLCLEHLDRATTFLDRQYANNTLTYMTEIWKHPVHLLTSDEDGRETTLTARPNI